MRAPAATEYFVAPYGADSNPGTSTEQPFATIQRGLDAMAAGDVLTIRPGEYFGAVERAELGAEGAQTIIRAEIPGTVLLRGDVAVDGFKAVDGYRFVYVTSFDRDPVAVLELDTLHSLDRRFGIAELEFEPGTFYYNEAESLLYLSSSDLRPPPAHPYRVSVTPVSGFLLVNPRGVVVEGIAATGYYPAEAKRWPYTNYVGGIVLHEPVDCVVRNCTAYLNGQGICMVGGTGNVIESSTGYGNGTKFHDQGGNFIRYQGNNDIIRNNLSYASNGESIKFYSGISGPVLLQGNISWGAWADYYIKGGEATKYGLAENNVGLSTWSVANVKGNLLGATNHYNADMTPDNVMLPGLDRDREFADFLNLDFRLQGDSSLRGSGPDGADRGPFPYRDNIYYISPDGDDANDGLATARAWRTLGHALARIKAGDTLYLLEGTYPVTGPVRLGSSEEEPVQILGRGVDSVRIAGDLVFENSQRLRIGRIEFERPVVVRGGGNLEFFQCMFRGSSTGLSLEGVSGAEIRHNEFTGFSGSGIEIADSTRVLLAGNIFDNAAGTAVVADAEASLLYSDYNVFRQPQTARKIAGAAQGVPGKAAGLEAGSSIVVPDYRIEAETALLQNPEAFAGAGPLGKPAGRHPTFPVREAALAGPFVHSTGDTTANIEWWTAGQSHCEVAWGETPDQMQSRHLFSNGYGALSLEGLEPGKTYRFEIRSLDPSVSPVPFRNYYREELAENIIGSRRFIHALPHRPDNAVVSFTTLAQPAPPRVFYVAGDGDDSRDGLSRAGAWRSINRAASAANAGDTILVAGGRYPETVWIRASGASGRPVLFRAAPGEKVILDGVKGTLTNGIVLRGKNRVHLDGFYFEGFGFGRTTGDPSCINAYASDDIEITRCFLDGRKVSYSVPFLAAWDCKRLALRNCVVMQAMNSGMFLYRCPDAIVQNCVLFRNYTCAATVVNKPGELVTFANSIITDLTTGKERNGLFEIPDIGAFRQQANCYHLRSPGAERAPVFFFYLEPGPLRLDEYFARAGAGGSVEGDPGYRAAAAMQIDPERPFTPDTLIGLPHLDFPDLFATRPDVVGANIGLQPDAFADFHFNQQPNPVE